MPIDQGKLLDACKRLVKLNEDRHPGLAVWNVMCVNAVEDLRAALGPDEVFEFDGFWWFRDPRCITHRQGPFASQLEARAKYLSAAELEEYIWEAEVHAV